MLVTKIITGFSSFTRGSRGTPRKEPAPFSGACSKSRPDADSLAVGRILVREGV